jgi:hypothetical protein
MPVRDLIKRLGGPTVVAGKAGVTPAAVSNWSTEDKVPPRHHAVLCRLARDKGVPWVPPGFETLPELLPVAQRAAA